MKSISNFLVIIPVLLSFPRADGQVAETRKNYEPTLLSINDHRAPDWFEDAKFGMFIDYGLYSVAGYAPKKDGAMYPDWYLYNMYHDPEVIAYHKEKWGKDFQRDDFIPLFTAEKFDADAIVKLAAEAGMKYVVPFCKHHDGFCLWPSTYTKRNSLDMGPKKDLIRPLVNACKKEGLKFGFYFSVEEWEYPILIGGVKKIRRWTGSLHDTIPYDEKEMNGKISGKIPVKDFFGDYIVPQAKEFINEYDPDILWFDGEWTTDINTLRTPEIVSYFYNNAAGRKEVACNDRLGANLRFISGDFFTSEYGGGAHEANPVQSHMLHKWEENRGISQSFGYNWQDTRDNIISTPQFIDMFVKIVSENGNLLLIVNLDGKGAMPEYIKTRLVDIGKWLKVNGEAIYGSRPWLVSHQGDSLRFTQSKDRRYVFAIHTGWPDHEMVIKNLRLDKQASIQLLGSEQKLQWKNVSAEDGGGQVVVEIPQSLKSSIPCDYAYTLKIQLAD
ncbi:MAG: alpha-L-fucosidase [Bacteroidota bacterium]|nr:alpha-L-fucosidase [Bacteroidota bacterium]